MNADIFVQRECVRVWLQRIARTDEVTRWLGERIEGVRAALAGVGYDPARQHGSGAKDSLSKGVVELIGLEDEWNERIVQYKRAYEQAQDLCAPDRIGPRTAWLRWVERLGWDEVAERTGYSRRQAISNADKGVEALFPYVPEDVRRQAFPNAAPKGLTAATPVPPLKDCTLLHAFPC